MTDKEQALPDSPAIRTRSAKINRGVRAPREGSGVVVGSGAAAGGTGGIEEGFDNDPVGGEVSIVMPKPVSEP